MRASILALCVTLVQSPPDTGRLSTQGRNTYFILEPGYRLTLEGTESRRRVELVVTVLAETHTVAGVATRVVEERERHDGQLAEVSRNYFAIDPVTTDVYYFGEDVDIYERGRIVNHEGAWLAGVRGARFGLMMPGSPRPGMRHFQEQAEGVAMDHAEVVSLGEKLTTPAGAFEKCLKVKETTPLEKGAVEYKIYAPGVGLIRDGSLTLTSYGFIR